MNEVTPLNVNRADEPLRQKFKTINMNLLIFVFLTVLFTQQLHGYQVKHPQEIDLTGFDADNNEDLLKWTSKRAGGLDCVSYYRRIVKYLFNRDRFKEDSSSGYFIGSISLRLKKEQWEMLVENDFEGLNMNEVDDLLASVLKQSGEGNWEYPAAQILFEHYKQQLIMSLPSLNSPVLMITVAFIAVVVTCRFFNFSKLTFSAIILLALLGICSVSYAMTYYDCLSDLEVEQMIQLSKQQSKNNPCKDYHGEHADFWSSMQATVFGSSENKCFEHMRKTFKTSKKYCDPLDVFAKWFGKIQMSYFSSVIGGIMEVITNISASSNIITKTVTWIIGAAISVYLVMAFGKVAIKSLFSGAFDALKTTKISNDSNREPSREFRELSVKMDEILHENQQMKRELTYIRECSVERTISVPSIEGIKRLHDIQEEEAPDKNTESEKNSTET
jgi:hypothetical protein